MTPTLPSTETAGLPKLTVEERCKMGLPIDLDAADVVALFDMPDDDDSIHSCMYGDWDTPEQNERARELAKQIEGETK